MIPDPDKMTPESKFDLNSKNINTNILSGSPENEMVIPVIEEFLTVKKEIVETGKITIRKRVERETARIDLPLVNDSYHIERVPVNKDLLETRPTIIEKDGNMIIPVVKEVAVTIIKYLVTEEIHVTKNRTVVPHQQEIELLKDKVTIERTH